jgi:hypothetical protein
MPALYIISKFLCFGDIWTIFALENFFTLPELSVELISPRGFTGHAATEGVIVFMLSSIHGKGLCLSVDMSPSIISIMTRRRGRIMTPSIISIGTRRRGRIMTPSIISIGSRRRGRISFTSPPSYPRLKPPHYGLYNGLDGS